jgi:hypothetical protein
LSDSEDSEAEIYSPSRRSNRLASERSFDADLSREFVDIPQSTTSSIHQLRKRMVEWMELPGNMAIIRQRGPGTKPGKIPVFATMAAYINCAESSARASFGRYMRLYAKAKLVSRVNFL